MEKAQVGFFVKPEQAAAAAPRADLRAELMAECEQLMLNLKSDFKEKVGFVFNFNLKLAFPCFPR